VGLKKGVACPLGAYMLEKFFARAAMLDIVYGCEALPTSWALDHKLLNELSEPDDLLRRRHSGESPLCLSGSPYRQTKQSINGSFISGLLDVAKVAKEVHIASFMSKSAEHHFDRVLSQRPQPQLIECRREAP